MRDASLSKGKRIAAAFMGLMLLLALLFSAVYIAAEAEHDCTGEHCHICAALQLCKGVLNQFQGGAIPRGICVAPLLLFSLGGLLFTCPEIQLTLISQKVRLNN